MKIGIFFVVFCAFLSFCAKSQVMQGKMVDFCVNVGGREVKISLKKSQSEQNPLTLKRIFDIIKWNEVFSLK